MGVDIRVVALAVGDQIVGIVVLVVEHIFKLYKKRRVKSPDTRFFSIKSPTSPAECASRCVVRCHAVRVLLENLGALRQPTDDASSDVRRCHDALQTGTVQNQNSNCRMKMPLNVPQNIALRLLASSGTISPSSLSPDTSCSIALRLCALFTAAVRPRTYLGAC